MHFTVIAYTIITSGIRVPCERMLFLWERMQKKENPNVFVFNYQFSQCLTNNIKQIEYNFLFNLLYTSSTLLRSCFNQNLTGKIDANETKVGKHTEYQIRFVSKLWTISHYYKMIRLIITSRILDFIDGKILIFRGLFLLRFRVVLLFVGYRIVAVVKIFSLFLYIRSFKLN